MCVCVCVCVRATVKRLGAIGCGLQQWLNVSRYRYDVIMKLVLDVSCSHEYIHTHKHTHAHTHVYKCLVVVSLSDLVHFLAHC